MKTIKVPANLANLSSRLPKSNYEKTRGSEHNVLMRNRENLVKSQSTRNSATIGNESDAPTNLIKKRIGEIQKPEDEYETKKPVVGKNQRGLPPRSLAQVNARSLKELEKNGVRSAGVNTKIASGAKSSIVRSSQVGANQKYDESPRLKPKDIDSPYDKRSVNKSTTGKSDTLERAIQHQVQLRKLQKQDTTSNQASAAAKKRIIGDDFLNDLKLPSVD